jgi:hypothetical protein
MRFVYSIENEPDFVAFMRDRIDLDLTGQNLDGPNWFCVTVREDVTGHVVAGIACEFKTPFDAHVSVAVDEPEAITRYFLRRIFRALFVKAARITALCEPGNVRAEDGLKRMGFVYEGFLRRGLDGERDALIYGMLPEDCKFLPGVRAARRSWNGDDRWSHSPKAPTHTTQRPRNSRLM